MSRKVCGVLAGLTISLAIVMSGCKAKTSADLSLKFAPDQTATYKSVSDVVKDFRFEQPNLGKLREEQTRTSVEMTFTQTVQRVDDEGSAIAQVTIDGLTVTIINKNEPRLSFDSSNEEDLKSPLAKVLGQSYTIRISPNGEVTVVDAKAALASVPSGYENKVVASLLSDENIIQRHQIQALPKDAETASVGSSWNVVTASPPGLLAPKSYKKVYTLSDIKTVSDSRIATVNMTAGEDAEPVAGVSAGGMGMFAKMFDNEDTYTGSMKIDLETGTLLKAEETLVSTYLAQEMPENGDPAKGPDTLTMQFTNRVGLEKLN
jgi:hypothetical protein